MLRSQCNSSSIEVPVDDGWGTGGIENIMIGEAFAKLS